MHIISFIDQRESQKIDKRQSRSPVLCLGSRDELKAS
jgi:hypothetical protein